MAYETMGYRNRRWDNDRVMPPVLDETYLEASIMSKGRKKGQGMRVAPEVGERIRNARIRLGELRGQYVSQDALARELEIPMMRLSKWERGLVTRPDRYTLYRLEQMVDYPEGFILRGNVPSNPSMPNVVTKLRARLDAIIRAGDQRRLTAIMRILGIDEGGLSGQGQGGRKR